MSIFNLLTILIIIVAILLVGAILLQEPKERITPSGGSSASVQRIGINQKADFLEKATWVLVSLLLFLTLLSSIFLKNTPQLNISPNLAKVQEEQALNAPLLPTDQEDATNIQKQPASNETKATPQN
ncbi:MULTISPECIES: preprotein translocase subunit SecG [Candidatus Cardinium]|uniref:preprotein translocase subunit SecG n=1 Tax=Candidatus Cardinium TaxID=273135 RepID=UPI001FAAEC23|nr:MULTISPECIES: preprotein translocase subunit SecG [Cardinium]